jgi:hypothetical protein
MSDSFKSTAEIWLWLLEKPEVNHIKKYNEQPPGWIFVCLKKDGNLNQIANLSVISDWSKHVELPKVTIDLNQLREHWRKHIQKSYLSEEASEYDLNKLSQVLGLL